MGWVGGQAEEHPPGGYPMPPDAEAGRLSEPRIDPAGGGGGSRPGKGGEEEGKRICWAMDAAVSLHALHPDSMDTRRWALIPGAMDTVGFHCRGRGRRLEPRHRHQKKSGCGT